MGLNPAQAKKILEANIVNLARKVGEGRPLSTQELALVQSVATDGEPTTSAEVWAANQVELADLLGVTRQTIHQWIKISGSPVTEANGRYNVAAWREWKKVNGRRGGDDDLDKGQLQAKNLLLQNERLAWQINILKKEYVPVLDVTKWGAELGTEVAKRLNMIPSLAASLVGLSVPDCELRLREIVDEALGSLHLLGERIQSAEREAVEAGMEAND